MNDDERALLTAATTDCASAPIDAIERLGHRRTFILMSAAMSDAVEQIFPDHTTPEQVRAYAAELFARYPAAETTPAAIETLIRSSLSETRLPEDLSYDDLLGTAFLLTYDLVRHLGFDEANREEFFTRAVAMADEVG